MNRWIWYMVATEIAFLGSGGLVLFFYAVGWFLAYRP